MHISAGVVFTNVITLYAGVIALISLISDGWSGKPSPFVHQLLLVPFTLCFFVLLYRLLNPAGMLITEKIRHAPTPLLIILLLFELWASALMVAEAHHFRVFGYHLVRWIYVPELGLALLMGVWLVRRPTGIRLLVAASVLYAAGVVLAIACFPLDYLRSDMLPVIGWADGRLMHHVSPYGTMHIGNRLYDFPYLPGMLVAFLPAVAFHLDLRWATLGFTVASCWLIFVSARPERGASVASLLSLFLVCPFLQYRHDLYLAPHWFSLAVAITLMQRRHYVWSAFAWGVSCSLYQLSWILIPFALLNAWRRRGWSEALKTAIATAAGFLMICGPFLRSALGRIASNTVGQWSRLPHAMADPINLSYWLTYLVRPDELKWVQAVVLVGIFGFCVVRQRCRSLSDTLRWMCCSLAIFIPLNVLVDGYFYLTLSFLLLMYICAASGDWGGIPEGEQTASLA